MTRSAPALLSPPAAAPPAGGLYLRAAAPPPRPAGVARVIGAADHVGRLPRQPHIEPVLLQVALYVVDGEPLHRHELENALWCGLVGAVQLCNRLHEARMQLGSPPQPRLGVLALRLRA